MIGAIMAGSPKALFRENIERYQDLNKQIQKYVEDHRKFAREECDLFKPGDENKAFKYCQSACHPDGEYEYNHCSIGLCTWWMEGAHGPSKEN
jgi:hypothetical protein